MINKFDIRFISITSSWSEILALDDHGNLYRMVRVFPGETQKDGIYTFTKVKIHIKNGLEE
jgi:hypothetical protein